MRYFLCTLPLLGLISLIIVKIVKSIRFRRWRAAEAARRGCLPAPTLPKQDLIGLRRLKDSIKATREERGPQYVVDAMNELGHDVHTLRLPVLDYELLVTRDPENVKAMFATQSQDFDIGTHRQNSFMPLLGQGVFTSRGEDWKHSRALVRPQFARDQVTDLDLFEQHVQALFNVLKIGQDNWTGKLDLAPLLFNFTLDVSTEFIWGQSVHSQDPSARLQMPHNWDTNGPDLAAFGHHLDEAKMWIDKKGALAKYNWLMRSNAFSVHCSEIKKFVDYFVQNRLTHGYDEKSLDTSRKPKFVLLDELAKETQDPVRLRNETLHVMLAGRDTTGCLLGWMFYFFARYPDVLAKTRDEIASIFGNDARPEKITFQGIQSCKYLQYVTHEVLRVVAVIPMNERVALHDTTLPRGGGPNGQSPIFVPKGNQVLIPKYAMQHRADIWGADVEEFKPERWENRKFGFEFVPFGAGPRQCIGRKSRNPTCGRRSLSCANMFSLL